MKNCKSNGKLWLVALLIGFFVQKNAHSQCLDGFCPDSIIALELGENTWFFQLDEFCSAGSVQWRIGNDAPVLLAGGSIYYTFSGEGTYLVEATPIESDCTTGQTITTSITIGIRSCASGFAAIRTNCGRLDFLLNPTTNYSFIEWLINGESVSASSAATFQITEEPQVIDVSVIYGTELCSQDTLNQTFSLDGCTGVCPDSIDTRFITCNVRSFSIPGFPADQNILWDFGDGSVEASENTGLQHVFTENGIYEVTASTFSDNCPDGIVMTTTLVIDGCSILLCPDALGLVNTGNCQEVEATTNNIPINAVASWNMGDGTVLVQSGTSLSYTYADPGAYTVCIESNLPGCEVLAPVCTTIIVPACGDGFCTTSFTATQTTGNTFALALINGPANTTVLWNFGDGNNLVGDRDVEHTYSALGTYTVTASFTDFDCDNETVVITQTITITGDFSGCPASIIVTPDNACGTYTFSTNLGTLTGNYTWSFGNGATSSLIQPSYTYPLAGNFIVGLTFSSSTCTFRNLTTTLVAPDCSVPEICPNSISTTNIDDCSSFEFSFGAPVGGEYVVWSFPDIGSFVGESSFLHQFEFGGSYEVCAYFANNQCPNGVSLCTEVEAINCNITCELNITQIDEICGGAATLVALNAPLNATINWTINGSPSGSGFSLNSELVPGTYNVCASYTIGDCPSTVSNCANITIDACTEQDCPTSFLPIATTACGTYSMSLERGAAFETVSWTVNGVAAGNDENLLYPFAEPGIYTICGTYTSASCTAGTTLCLDFDAPSCNDCPSQLQFIDVSCQSLSVQMGDPFVPATVIWDFGDGTSYSGGPIDGHLYSSSGLYTITGTYSSAFCAGVSLSRTIFIQSCEPECVAFTDVEFLGCTDISLSASIFPSNALVTWNLLGSELQYTGTNVSINGLLPGNNTICTQVASEFCPQGFEICLDYFLEDCSPISCPEFLIATPISGSCGLYQLQVPEAATGSSVVWSNNGNTVSGPALFTYQFTQPGNNTISAQYTGSDCPAGTTLSTVLSIPDCDFDCALTASATETATCGFYEFNAVLEVENIPIVWTVDNIVVPASQVDNFRLFEGAYEICATTNSDGCASNQSFCFTTVADTCIVIDCPESIIVTPTGACGEFNFFIPDAHPTAQVNWNFPEFVPNDEELTYTYSFPGNYNVTAQYTAFNCPDGITLTTQVDFLPCPVPCSLNVAVTSQTCIGATAEATFDPPGGIISWQVNGSSVTGNNTQLDTSLPTGINTICATYSGANCIQNPTACAPVTIAPCPDNCPENILVLPGASCGEFIVTAPEFISGNFLWTANNQSYTTSGFQLNLSTPGTYPITLSYQSADCFLGTNLSTVLQFEACPEPCTVGINTALQDCGNLVLTAAVPFGQQPSWTINGETAATGFILNENLDPGTYNICVSYIDNTCPNDDTLTACQTIVIEDCLPCTLDITVNDLNQELPSGNDFLFSVAGVPGFDDVTWDFGDGTVVLDDDSVQHAFPTSGTFAVCAAVQDELCGTRTVCAPVQIDPCSDPFLYRLRNLNTSDLTYNVINENNETVYIGFVDFSFNGESVTDSLCLPDGCYRVSVSAQQPLASLAEIPDMFEIISDESTIWYSPQLISNGFDVYFGHNAQCPANTNCNLSISSFATSEEGEVEFSASYSPSFGESFDVAWTFGDGATGTGATAAHTYIANGSFTACAQLTTAFGCEDQECIAIEMYSADAACNDVEVQLEWSALQPGTNADSLVLSLLNEQQALVQSYVLMTNDASPTLSLCLPDSCFYLQLSTYPLHSSSVSVVYTFLNESDTLTVTNPNTSDIQPLPLNSNCPGLSASERIEGGLELFPNPTSGWFTLRHTLQGAVIMDILDVTGRRIMESALYNGQQQINVEHLANGWYTVRLRHSGGVSAAKLHIVR